MSSKNQSNGGITRNANNTGFPVILGTRQRLHCPSRILSFVLHGLGLCSFVNSFVYLHTHPNPINQSYGWHFQYLTIIGKLFASLSPCRLTYPTLGLLIATITFTVGLAADLASSSCTTLFTVKNELVLISAPVFTSRLPAKLTMQLEALITMLYWSIHFYD